MNEPRLRGKRIQRKSLYSLGQFPNAVLTGIGKQIVCLFAMGNSDITGDGFGTIFAGAIDGIHRASPLGIADVEKGSCAWSVKTVKSSKPFNQRKVRLISGRNSPAYSHGIDDPFINPHKTGGAVLSIWNARVNEAFGEFSDLRIAVLIRNVENREFVLFEEEAQRFVPENFEWKLNKNRNFEGYDVRNGEHCFTWQSHGGQFTVIKTIPGSARRFSIVSDIPKIDPASVLNAIDYSDEWIHIH